MSRSKGPALRDVVHAVEPDLSARDNITSNPKVATMNARINQLIARFTLFTIGVAATAANAHETVLQSRLPTHPHVQAAASIVHTLHSLPQTDATDLPNSAINAACGLQTLLNRSAQLQWGATLLFNRSETAASATTIEDLPPQLLPPVKAWHFSTPLQRLPWNELIHGNSVKLT